ncbi:hypothetical protein [Brevibacterium oceani]|uniref:hypothetical protein n=1 Tax=Brevibacterium oceani TaxID=358099 RepID=UPI0015E6D82A|nr:hypothetical protein [Brevibacterium oceani]
MANAIKLKDFTPIIPAINEEDQTTTAFFIVFRDAERKAILNAEPNARVFLLEFYKGADSVTWKNWNNTYQVTGLDHWESGEVEDLHTQRAIIVAPSLIYADPKKTGAKVLQNISDYFESIGSKTSFKRFPGYISLDKVLESEDGFLFSDDEAEAEIEEREEKVDPRIFLNRSEAIRLNEIVLECSKVARERGSLFWVRGEVMKVVGDRMVSVDGPALKGWTAKHGLMFVTPTDRADVPKLIAEDAKSVMATPELWEGKLNELETIETAPVLGKSLKPRFEAGYDADTLSYVVEPMNYLGELEGEISPEKGAEAAERLMKWFDGFAFVDQRSKADALAFALTPLLMHYLDDPIPGGLITANRSGTGKTEAARIIALMSGDDAIENDWPSEAKTRETITSMLNSGKQVAIFDNIKANVDSPGIEALLTSRKWNDRVLFTQNQAEIKNNTVLFLTANHASTSPDMLRRLVPLPMNRDAISAEEQAKWDGQRKKNLQDNREAVLIDLLTMILAWRDAGTPLGNEVYDGFQEWAETLGGILAVSGVQGFLETREDNLAGIDSGKDTEREMLARILRVMDGHETWSAKDLVDELNMTSTQQALNSEQYVKDRMALKSYLVGRSVKDQSSAIGKKLGPLCDPQILPGVELVRGRTGAGRFYSVKTSLGKTDYRELIEIANA